MKKARYHFLFLVFFPAILQTSCLSLKESLTLNEDLSGSLILEYETTSEIHKELVTFVENEKSAGYNIPVFPTNSTSFKEILDNSSGLESMGFEKLYDGDRVRVSLQIKFQHIKYLRNSKFSQLLQYRFSSKENKTTTLILLPYALQIADYMTSNSSVDNNKKKLKLLDNFHAEAPTISFYLKSPWEVKKSNATIQESHLAWIYSGDGYPIINQLSNNFLNRPVIIYDYEVSSPNGIKILQGASLKLTKSLNRAILSTKIQLPPSKDNDSFLFSTPYFSSLQSEREENLIPPLFYPRFKMQKNKDSSLKIASDIRAKTGLVTVEIFDQNDGKTKGIVSKKINFMDWR